MNQTIYALIFMLIASSTFAQITITDADLVGKKNYTWTSDNTYLLDGYVFLEAGSRLFIEPGTVIKGKANPTGNDAASALIIARDAQIFAEGTAAMPIIFTSEDDDVSDPFDLDIDERGKWGGLIILGRASHTDEACEIDIEGVAVAPGDTRVRYGAASCQFDDADNSGVLRYVSVRHAGSKLEDGDEINGITLGAVGNGTTIEFVEVFANDDDGIEWFGGTVNVKYAVVAMCKDDSFDWDTGFKGKGQFWLSLHGSDKAGNGGEHDGAKPIDAAGEADPVIYNATFIGAGVNATGSGQGDDHALLFRDNSAGDYANSIFTEFTGYAIQVEDRPSSAVANDSRTNVEDGSLTLKNNIWFGFGEGSEFNAGANGIINVRTDADDLTAAFLVNHLENNGNTIEDPQLAGISRDIDLGFDPRPADNGPAYNNLASYPSDDFFCAVPFKGAFAADGVWIKGWTAVDEYGILSLNSPASPNECLSTSTNDLFLETKGYLLGQNRPNPAGYHASIDFTLPVSENINFDVYNATGQLIQTVARNTWFAEGAHVVELNTADLPNGIYFYRLSTSKVQLTKSMIIQK